ncbi:OB-fold nucleic acid binding domain-containing protein [Streptomyces sedi]|uniref:DNA-binding protein n=1 Tax=Streptomyces sedi TaxID=555059 RepID=A0A5C4V731_9ACTN|nr:OB-fold nucleic acid binding domain-containing protein [Streptomyces sedi]TNM31742.1 DNA-binding protein [Streptomyces sedi]
MSAEGRAVKRGGRLRRLLGRPDEGETGEDLAADPAAVPCTRIGDCAGTAAGRPVVHVTGTLRAVRERSVAGMPALEARLDDGSASLNVVWLGRRAIPGIEPGREMVASGRIAVTDGRAVLFNPRYQLQARGQE